MINVLIFEVDLAKWYRYHQKQQVIQTNIRNMYSTYFMHMYQMLVPCRKQTHYKFAGWWIYMRQEVKLVYRKYDRGTDFEDFRTHMFQSVEKFLNAVGSWLIVRLKADDSFFEFRKNIGHKNSSLRTTRHQMY